MDARNDRRGAARGRERRRHERPALEPLETRDLMAAGGSITDIATLPAGLKAGPMAVGSDNNLWFAEMDRPGGPALGKLSATGLRSEVPLPAADADYTITGVAADAQGNIWYALAATPQTPSGSPAGKIGKVATGGAVTEYALPSSQEVPGALTVGADGNLYATVSGGPSGPGLVVVKANGSVTEMPVKGAAGPLTWLTKGPDGNLWFVDGTKIGKITPAGVATEYTVPAPVGSGGTIDLTNAQLTAGPDGNLWFLGLGGIAKITPTGTVTSIGGSGALITGLSEGSDGNLWFALSPPAGSQLEETAGEVVLRMAADGSLTPLPDHVDTGTNVLAMTPGNGSIWLNEGGTAFSRINVASIPGVTPASITPTTPHAVSTDARKVFAGAIVSFTANYPGALPTDFTATINYGDGYTGTGTVVADPTSGFDVLGYDVYNTLPVGSQVKVTVDITALNGSTDEIYGVVDVAGPAVKAKAAPKAKAKAAHPKAPVTHAKKK